MLPFAYSKLSFVTSAGMLVRLFWSCVAAECGTIEVESRPFGTIGLVVQGVIHDAQRKSMCFHSHEAWVGKCLGNMPSPRGYDTTYGVMREGSIRGVYVTDHRFLPTARILAKRLGVRLLVMEGRRLPQSTFRWAVDHIWTHYPALRNTGSEAEDRFGDLIALEGYF